MSEMLQMMAEADNKVLNFTLPQLTPWSKDCCRAYYIAFMKRLHLRLFIYIVMIMKFCAHTRYDAQDHIMNKMEEQCTNVFNVVDDDDVYHESK